MDNLPRSKITNEKTFDPDEMNERRAEFARSAINQFMIMTGTDWSDSLSDLICDLMHLCDRDKELDFESQISRGREAYLAEISEEG